MASAASDARGTRQDAARTAAPTRVDAGTRRAGAARRRCRACCSRAGRSSASRCSSLLGVALPVLRAAQARRASGTAVHHIEHGDKWWIAIGVVLELLSFAGYVVLFRAVFVRGHEPHRLAREL